MSNDRPDPTTLLEAARRGERRAQYNLGVWYLEAGGADPGAAVEWFEAAAGQDYAPARSALGYLHLRGHGVAIDLERARGLFAAAADAGYVDAQYRLAELTIAGVGGKSDPAAGLAWLERAARDAHLPAATQLAYCLEHGIGTAVDIPGARDRYADAARAGAPRARFWLASRIESGIGFVADPALAAAWYQLAADDGYPGSRRSALRLRGVAGDARADALLRNGAAGLPQARVDPETARIPVDLGVSVVCQRPRIFRIPALAAPDECAHLVQRAAPWLRPSRVLQRGTGAVTQARGRRSGGASLSGPLRDAVVWNLEQRLARVSGLPAEHGEPLAILHYQTGDEYRTHVDYFDPAIPGHEAGLRHGGQRLATVLIYLDDVARGGETRFPEPGVSIEPARGLGVLFFNCTPEGMPDALTRHAGAPVLEGEKWLATRWIRERPPGAGSRPTEATGHPASRDNG